MGGGGKNSPQQQDPGSLMAMQAGANQLNQYSPYGNIEYYGDRKIRIPGKPDIHLPEGQRTTLSPDQQRLFDQRNAAQFMMGNLGIGLAGQFGGSPMPQYQGPGQYNPVYMENLPGFSPTSFEPGDFEASRSAAERAVFDRGMSLMRPELAREDASIRQRLANQGLPQASDAYRAEMGRYETSRAEQMDRLAQSAVLQGLGAQQQGFGQQFATHGANEQGRFGAHQSNLQAAMQAHQMNTAAGMQAHQMNAGNSLAAYQANQGGRAQQLQEILGLFGLQGVQLPQAQGGPQIDVPYGQGGGGGPGAGQMALTGALGGAGTGAAFGPWGAGIGAGLGGLFGLAAGY